MILNYLLSYYYQSSTCVIACTSTKETIHALSGRAHVKIKQVQTHVNKIIFYMNNINGKVDCSREKRDGEIRYFQVFKFIEMNDISTQFLKR